MLYYALLFLLIALIAGFLGFGGVAFAAAGIAKICFFYFSGDFRGDTHNALDAWRLSSRVTTSVSRHRNF